MSSSSFAAILKHSTGPTPVLTADTRRVTERAPVLCCIQRSNRYLLLSAEICKATTWRSSDVATSQDFENCAYCEYDRYFSFALNNHATATQLLQLIRSFHSLLHDSFFSERELKFMFAICHRPSVCLSSVVCNVGAPYSGDWHFRQCFYAIWYLGHPWPFGKNFTEIVPGEPLRWGVKPKRVSQI